MSSGQTELSKAYFESIKEISEGEIIKGKVITVNPTEVVVDVGYKSEGIILHDGSRASSLKKARR